MLGRVGIVDPCDFRASHAFALHLVEKIREAVGEVVERRPGSEVRIRVEQRLHEPCEIEPPADRRSRGRQIGINEIAPEIGDKPDAGQEPRPPPLEEQGDAPFHPARVHPELDSGEVLRPEAPVAGEKPVHERRGEVDPGGEGEDGAHAFSRRRASAARSPSGEPASHQRPE